MGNETISQLARHHSAPYGLVQVEGFLISSMRPAMFLRKRLCMFFSSMSRSFITGFMVAAAMAAERDYARWGMLVSVQPELSALACQSIPWLFGKCN